MEHQKKIVYNNCVLIFLFFFILNNFKIRTMSPYIQLDLTDHEINIINQCSANQEWVYINLDIIEIFQYMYPNDTLLSIDKLETVKNKVQYLLDNKNLNLSYNENWLTNLQKYKKDLISGKAILGFQYYKDSKKRLIAFLAVH